MNRMLLALCVLAAPALVHAEEMYRWRDADGSLHYTNIERNAPSSATAIETQIVVEADHMPGAELEHAVVEEVGGTPPAPTAPAPAVSAPLPTRSGFLPDGPQVYDEARKQFGCFQASVLSSGGFSHPDDIATTYNCLPYRLGPRAWLNAAKAELAVRENGIDPRQMVQLYQEYYGPTAP
jgi:hypothetical protein